MTDATVQGTKAPLGVGTILSETFSTLFGNFVKVIALGFVGALVGLLVNTAFLGFDVATGTGEPDILNPNTILIGTVFSTVINIAVYGLVTALLIQLAYDSKLGRSNSMGTYFKAALPAIVPIAVLSIVVAILSGIGAIALLIGALWVYAVFYVMAPVAVIERGGFGSLGRSANLTKEYRWPIVGLFVLLIIITVIIQMIGGFIVGLVAVGTAGGVGTAIAGLLFALIGSLGYSLGGIATALVYARLRDIKEGVAVDEIASVFD